MNPVDRVIVALDVAKTHEAMGLMHECREGTMFKFHPGFLWAGDFLEEVVDRDYNNELCDEFAYPRPVSFFADTKYHDIPETVSREITRLTTRPKLRFCTVHAIDENVVRAAVLATRGTELKVLSVPFLTSENATPAQILARVLMAQSIGVDGTICSPQEIETIRKHVADDFLVVTPGIRPASDGHMWEDDQVRTGTPAAAIKAGANYIVVGRPICAAEKPRDAFLAIVDQVSNV